MGLNSGQLPDALKRCLPGSVRKAMGKAGMTYEEACRAEEVRLEKQIHKHIVGWLMINEVAFRHDRMDRATTGTLGWPDFTFCVNGVALGVEVKLPGKDLDPDQVACHARMARDGWTLAIVHSLDEFIALFRWMKKRACSVPANT